MVKNVRFGQHLMVVFCRNTIKIMNYKVHSEELIFDQFFRIKKAKIEHDLFDGGSVTVHRLCFERGDSVAILIYEKDTNLFLFTKQFRYPAVAENGWIVELTAGSIDEGENPEHAVQREVEEEIGYKIKDMIFINSFFVSPGGTSERIFLYYAEVETTDKVYVGGGKLSENENIELVKFSFNEIKKMLENNLIRDAKTIIALQWIMLNQSRI